MKQPEADSNLDSFAYLWLPTPFLGVEISNDSNKQNIFGCQLYFAMMLF